MFGIAAYLGLAMATAVAVFLFSEWTRGPGLDAPDHPGRLALVAGLLWPVVLIGLGQLALVAAARNRSARQPEAAPPARVGAMRAQRLT